MKEVVHARGHENVSGEHRSTFEVTTDDFLTPAGDCILAVEADRAPADFDPGFVAACQDESATITVAVAVGDREQSVTGRGDPELTFDSDRSLVCRTSDHVDDRTVALHVDHGAIGFDREMVDALASGADLTITLRVDA